MIEEWEQKVMKPDEKTCDAYWDIKKTPPWKTKPNRYRRSRK